MFRTASGVLMFLVATVALPAAPEPGEATLPATSLERDSNNPAKAAIQAKQAQDKEKDKEKAEQKVAADDVPAPPPGPIVSNAELVQGIEAALRNDIRTARLGIAVKLDEDKLIGLHGSVPSIKSRTTVIAVAAKVAGAARVKSYLVVRKQN